MSVYVDTSAFYALIVADDPEHAKAAAAFRELRGGAERIMTSSYVLAEATALLQVRVGLAAVRTLHQKVRSILDVIWVGPELHESAMTALLAAGRRSLSLVDWVGFTIMRRDGIERAFALDDDFRDQGFELTP